MKIAKSEDQELQQEKLDLAPGADRSEQRVSRLAFSPEKVIIAFTLLTAWVANYLHFTNFGLYEDDWYFVGFPLVVTLRTWLTQSLWHMISVPQLSVGRQLQMIFNYLFAAVGAAADSIAVDYFVAFVLFATSCVLLYRVLRHRFTSLVSFVAALLFVLTPLDTLHQFLNGEFSVGPAFILIFSAMLLYLNGRRIWASLLAFACIFTYESVFLLFLGVPLLQLFDSPSGRWRTWIRHVSYCAVIVACALISRKLSGETRVGSMPHGLALLWPVIHCCIFYSFASFATYLYALLRLNEATLEAWIYASVFFVSAAVLLFWLLQPKQQDPKQQVPKEQVKHESSPRRTTLLGDLAIACAFLFLGFAASYFFFFDPHPHLIVTDRATRVSIAGSFGSSLLFAVLLSAWMHATKTKAGSFVACAATSAFLTVLFLYSFVIQADYVNDWEQQREEAQQILALTPDAKTDSILILKLSVGGDDFFSQHPRRRAIGLEKHMFEGTFRWTFGGGKDCPTLFVVYSDAWVKYLKPAPDGYMQWTQPMFDGRWNAAIGRFRPGRFIVLAEKEPGWIVREYRPLQAAGMEIVQPAATVAPGESIWSKLPRTRLASQVLPQGLLDEATRAAFVPIGASTAQQ